ncbi:DUF6183 family protein [Kitasatospora purpeofusca]|uniref:DUF6183 family protein n=1 Tax=Kitasatospora purpeofusca TaxID=67352 RepID=UPI0035C8D673
MTGPWAGTGRHGAGCCAPGVRAAREAWPGPGHCLGSGELGRPRRSRKVASRRGLSSSRSRTGRCGAYGQLHVWPSLASPAGAPTDAPASEVEAPVRACARYRFGADTPWFHRVVWDVGVLAVSPDFLSLAVLAVTTTD